MKRRHQLLKISFVILFFLMNCTLTNAQFIEDYYLKDEINLNSQEWRSKNGIKSIQITNQKISNNKASKKVKPGNYYEFNEKGLLVKRTFKDGKQTGTFEYDDKDRIIQEMVVEGNKIIIKHEFKYNSSGKLSEEIWNEDKAIYFYDDNERLMKVEFPNSKKFSKSRLQNLRFVYGESGRVTEILTCYFYTNAVSDDIACAGKIKLDYDDNGNLIGEKVYGPTQLSAIMFSKKECMYFWIKYEYTEDQSHIQKRMITEGERPSLVYTYQLFQDYYNYDFLKYPTLSSMYYNESNYSYPFTSLFYDGYTFTSSGTSTNLSFNEGKLSDIVVKGADMKIQKRHAFIYDEEGILKEVMLFEADPYSETYRLLTRKVYNISITKF